jgi:hypothetical protein
MSCEYHVSIVLSLERSRYSKPFANVPRVYVDSVETALVNPVECVRRASVVLLTMANNSIEEEELIALAAGIIASLFYFGSFSTLLILYFTTDYKLTFDNNVINTSFDVTLLTEEARLKQQYCLIADKLKEVRNKKDELLLKTKKRAACSAQCPHKVELEQLRKELADLK